MQKLFEQFLIFKRIDQINLQEYCFYAQDKENHLCFIYIDGHSVEIEFTKYELMKLKKLSSHKIESKDSLAQNLKQIFSEIQPQDEQESICSLSLDSIFVDKISKEIIVPKFIKTQLSKSKHRDLFIQNFFYNLMNHFMEKDDTLYEENIENIKTMKRIVKKKLDLNDKVSNEIKQLFETFLFVSIEKIKQISYIQNDQYYNQAEYDRDDYKFMKQFYDNYLIDRQKIPDEDLESIREFFINYLSPKNANQIYNRILEFRDYQKDQQGIRLQSNKMYYICKQEFPKKQEILSKEIIKQGYEQKKNALITYKSNHSDIKLKYTKVLVNLNWTYICGKPDALIYDNNNNMIGMIQVKSTYKQQKLEQNQNLKLDYNVDGQGKVLSLKKDHKYYYQVQINLLITELSYCVFMISTQQGYQEIIVRRDETLIKQIIKKSYFYYCSEIIPSYCRLRKKKIEEEDLIRIQEKEIKWLK